MARTSYVVSARAMAPHAPPTGLILRRHVAGFCSAVDNESTVVAALAQFDDLWKALIPAEQARIVQLLVARINVSEAGLAIDLRHDGLGAIAALMAPPKKEVA